MSSRVTAATTLLGDPTFVRVCRPEDPDWPPDAGDVQVCFNDLASHTFRDLVEESANYLANHPDVHDVAWEDRELNRPMGRNRLRCARSGASWLVASATSDGGSIGRLDSPRCRAGKTPSNRPSTSALPVSALPAVLRGCREIFPSAITRRLVRSAVVGADGHVRPIRTLR